MKGKSIIPRTTSAPPVGHAWGDIPCLALLCAAYPGGPRCFQHAMLHKGH